MTQPADLVQGSDGWRTWLERTNQSTFRHVAARGSFTARREAKGGRSYWYAYRKQRGKLRKSYLGRSDDLTLSRLQAVAAHLAELAAAPADPSQGQHQSAHQSRLPISPTPLIGRDQDIASACARLLQPGVRLLTLTGPGGIGKTRLAIAVAEAVHQHFQDGVWFVDLSPIVDASLVLREIAHRLGVHDSSDRPVRERLHEHLSKRCALIVLDNLEQVLPAASELAALLDACPTLKLLATSREPLHLRVESQLAVPPLALPDLGRLPPSTVLEHIPAVELFLRRAQAAGASPEFDDATASDVAAVCVRLDGLPLAIELAAARARLFSPRAMLVRLDQQLDLLRAAEHDRATRHQSLRAASAWSCDLLSPEERRAFNWLSVFANGCTLEAAEGVLGGSGVLDHLASLVDKSLVRSDAGPDGEPRLRMLETTRAYGLEQLAASGDEAHVRLRHANYYLDLVKPPSWDTLDLPTPEFIAQVGLEHDNIRAALRFTLDAGETNTAFEIALSIQGFWMFAGYLSEGLRWLREALARPTDASPLAVAKAYHAAGQLAWRQGDYEAATTHYEASVALRRQIGDPLAVAIGLQGLASVARDRGESQRAIALWEECLATFRAAGHRPRVARAGLNLAIALHLSGESERAARLLDETVALAREVGQDWAQATALTYVALIALDVERDVRRAAAYVRDGVALLDRVPDAWVTAHLVELTAYLAAETGDDAGAAQLLAASAAVRASMGARLHPAFRAIHARYEDRLQSALDTTALDVAAQQGRALSERDLRRLAARAADSAAAVPPTAPVPGRPDTLSEREREVALLVAHGLTSREIAKRLVIGERTVETHVDHIRAKLGVRSRAQIAAWAVDRGLITTLS